MAAVFVVEVVICSGPSRRFLGGSMLVQRVLMPASSLESWTVLGDGGGPVEPIERYLAYLTDIERSPNTVKAYAHDLKDWFVFLSARGLDWREVRLEDLGRVRGLAAVAAGWQGWRGAHVALGRASLRYGNRQPQAVGDQRPLHVPRPARRRSRRPGHRTAPGRRRRSGWKPFLYHLSERRAGAAAHDQAPDPRKHPTLLTAGQVQAILDACTRLRDRLLWALLWDTGIRIGEALGSAS